MADDARFFGLPEAVRGQLSERTEAATFELWPRNAAAWNAFLTVCNQWVRRPDGRLEGLDYCRVEAGLRMADIAVSPALFLQLRIIESTILQAVNQAAR